jgi:putative mRNA 3-end processing factor
LHAGRDSFVSMSVITATDRGLYCADGDFYIDPWQPVARAVLTHAHGDHARSGSALYIAAEVGAGLLRLRLGADMNLQPKLYGAVFELGRAKVSLHSAGHVLGSAQVRIEVNGTVWVVTGDYKRAADPTCQSFEPVPCDVLISEATFALPCYRWPETKQVVGEIFRWWQTNRERGHASVLFCYALGKAQRVLAELTAQTNEAVYLHGAVAPLVEEYRRAGVQMLATLPVVREKKADYAGALVIAPPSAAGTPWMRRFGEASTGFCSGWMRIRGARRRRGYDRGFILSDHADWPALLQTITDSGASRVLLTHGYSDALVRYLCERGIDAAALRTAYGDEEQT